MHKKALDEKDMSLSPSKKKIRNEITAFVASPSYKPLSLQSLLSRENGESGEGYLWSKLTWILNRKKADRVPLPKSTLSPRKFHCRFHSFFEQTPTFSSFLRQTARQHLNIRKANPCCVVLWYKRRLDDKTKKLWFRCCCCCCCCWKGGYVCFYDSSNEYQSFPFAVISFPLKTLPENPVGNLQLVPNHAINKQTKSCISSCTFI